MHFPAEKCLFMQKMHFPAEKWGFRGAHGRKPQEIAGGFQGSRIKNASQLSQDFSARQKTDKSTMDGGEFIDRFAAEMWIAPFFEVGPVTVEFNKA